jgi:AcrR family transcriptional regulator
LIEEHGLEGFSTRKLGEALGCEAMSIYHHFPSKTHLLNALVDRLIAGVVIPPRELEPIERIRRLAYGYRRIGHQHPRLFPYVALYRMNSPVGLRFLNDTLGMFRDAGLDAEAMARLFRAFAYYLIGAALDETLGYSRGPSAVEPVSDAQVARDYPLVALAGPYFKQEHFDRTFAAGLEPLLEAIRDAAERAKRHE